MTPSIVGSFAGVGVRMNHKCRVCVLPFQDGKVLTWTGSLSRSDCKVLFGIVLSKIQRTLIFIIINRESESYKEDQYMIVGVMKDKKPKVRGLHVSYTLGCSEDWNT
jgi:hypothetical protein